MKKNSALSCTLSSLLLVLGLANLVAAADWPEFRGPTRQGVVSAKNLPTQWSPTENIGWRTELPGEGWSSPIVIGESIYLTAAIPRQPSSVGEESSKSGGYELVVLMIDARSGGIAQTVPLFSQPASAPQIHTKNSHASPTPVFDGNQIYVHFGHQGTACISPAGEVIWKNDGLSYVPVHGSGGSAIVVDDRLIFSRDGAETSDVTALDTRTGEIAWQTPRGADVDKLFSFCTPLLLDVEGVRQVILPGSGVVQSLDPANGRERWRVRFDGYSVIPRPVYESGLVFICTGYNRSSLLAIDPTGSGDVTDTHVKWRAGPGVSHTPSPIAVAGRVMTISDSGIALCVDALDGHEIWKKRIGGNFSASPLLVDGKLYVLSEEGVCTILDVSSQPQEIAENAIKERCLASFAVVDEDLLLRTDKALYRLTK